MTISVLTVLMLAFFFHIVFKVVTMKDWDLYPTGKTIIIWSLFWIGVAVGKYII